MNKKKLNTSIVFLLNHMDYGGCQKIVFDLILGVYKSFNKVYLIAKKGYYSELLNSNTSIQFIDRADMSVFGVVKSVKEIQKSHPSLILHTHNRIDILFKYALRKSDIHLHTFHSAYLNNNFLYKFLKPEKSVSISMTVKRYLNRYNIDNQMIYNGVDVHTSQKHFRPKQLEAPKLLYVGRLSEEKGFDKLLKALLVYKYNGTNQIQFDVVGDGVNIESYKNIVESSEGSLKVNFKGYIPNPWDNINEYDILVIPSYFEGFCLVAAEGASLGIPIVGNNILALREVLSFLPDSNFFDIHDPNSIHITITECLTNILGQRTLALDNTAKITDKFSKKRMLLNYLKAYESFS